ncbi:MAG: site-specific DNA-methyltransferase [Candidatus Dormibacteraeota bacterium]|nr:site-specific DNA-methyltransferase [Candidatus Dormibacteraeota bacterium]
MTTVVPPDQPGAGMIVAGESLALLAALPDRCAGLVYADPPFNTGSRRDGFRLRTVRDTAGARRGFGGASYRSEQTDIARFDDSFGDYIGWLRPRLEETRRILAAHGTLYLHVDPRESHYCKVLLDELFGRECFLNEVIWAYDYGARSSSRWPAKHDVILVYARTAGAHHFDLEEVERIPYMAPGLQTSERAARGKTPTDVWWHTIVPTTSRERTGYPTQKPVGILRRIVAASSHPADLVVDWCAGSGTTGAAALELGRRFLLCDSSAAAIAVMRERFGEAVPVTELR